VSGISHLKIAPYISLNLISDGIFPKGEFESLCEESALCLKKGMSRFQSVGDKANKALLLSNKGRLFRVKAQEQSQSLRASGKEFSKEERNSYKQVNKYITLRVRVMVFNAIFNNISAISWQSVLLVEETGVP
jgi:hypothetical protein